MKNEIISSQPPRERSILTPLEHEAWLELKKANPELASFEIGEARAEVDNVAKPVEAIRERVLLPRDSIEQISVRVATIRHETAANSGDLELAK